jgi:hypothetical protein
LTAPVVSLSTPIIQINTTGAFLASTTAFVASPTHTDNAAPNSAISPTTKTLDFFSTSHTIIPPPRPVLPPLKTADFFAVPRALTPPRPNVSVASDVESDVEATFEKATVVPAGSPSQEKFPRRLSQPGEKPPVSHSNTASTRPLIFPNNHQNSPSHDSRSRRIAESHRDQVYDVQSSEDSDWDNAGDTPVSRAPPVRSRTIVSTTHRVKAESATYKIRPQRRQPSPARRHTPPPSPTRRDERATKPKPLSQLLEEVKSAIGRDTTAYYAIKGVLAEFDEKKSRFSKENEPASIHFPERQGYDAPSASPLHHNGARNRHDEFSPVEPAPRRFRRDPPQAVKIPRPAPAPKYSLTQTSDEASGAEEEEQVRKVAVNPCSSSLFFLFLRSSFPRSPS